MKLELNFTDYKESNKFLRAFWAGLRGKYGKCAWNFIPHKDGNKKNVFLGFMDIGVPNHLLRVSVDYKTKGCVKNLIIANDKGEIDCSIKNEIIEISKSAKNAVEISFSYYLRFKPLHGLLLDYKGENFEIGMNKGHNTLFIRVKAYDEADAKSKLNEARSRILALLAVLTNSAFLDYNGKESVHIIKKENSVFYSEQDWIDGFPYNENFLSLSEYALKVLDNAVNDELDHNFNLIVKAAIVFHSARKLDAQINDRLRHKTTQKTEKDEFTIYLEERDKKLKVSAEIQILNTEISNLLYISSLETLSLLEAGEDNARCNECNQLIYSISKRVYDFVSSILDDFVAKQIKELYNERSEFVHTGALTASYNYSGVTIPQLDKSSKTGCKQQLSYPNLNLREYTSFCFRKVLRDEFA